MKQEKYEPGEYKRLVGNKVPNKVRKEGYVPVVHVASDAEFWFELKSGLKHSSDELFASSSVSEMTERLAQIQETLRAIADFADIDERRIENARDLIETRDGSFSKRIILDRINES